MQVTIYHNPRCATSRRTLDLLRRRGIEPTVIEYLKAPPSAVELERLLRLLGVEARELLRTKEPDYRKCGLENPKLSRRTILAAMVRNPRLIERPIVVVNSRKAALGRPPENILRLIT